MSPAGLFVLDLMHDALLLGDDFRAEASNKSFVGKVRGGLGESGAAGVGRHDGWMDSCSNKKFVESMCP